MSTKVIKNLLLILILIFTANCASTIPGEKFMFSSYVFGTSKENIWLKPIPSFRQSAVKYEDKNENICIRLIKANHITSDFSVECGAYIDKDSITILYKLKNSSFKPLKVSAIEIAVTDNDSKQLIRKSDNIQGRKDISSKGIFTIGTETFSLTSSYPIKVVWKYDNEEVYSLFFDQPDYITKNQFEEMFNSSLERKVIFNKCILSFTYPSNNWEVIDMLNDTDRLGYIYMRKGLYDQSGMETVPTVGFIFEKLRGDEQLIEYSNYLIGNLQYKIEKTFTHEDGIITINNAIGYISSYMDSYNIEHTIIFVHAINNESGVQIIMDVTSEVYPQVKDDFFYILKSLAFSEDT